MDFFDIEEDQRPAQEEVTHLVPNPSFSSFLRLPREIRDTIYYYALVRPYTGPYIEPTGICYMHHKPSSRHASKLYWGTEKSTRLFRVNHQVYSEASEIFYSTFPFHFPASIDIALINHTLRDTLNIRARTLIRKVGFMVPIRSIPYSFTPKDDDKRLLAFEAIAKLLPNIRQVEINVALVGHDAPEWQVMEVVNRVSKTFGPLKDLPGLTIYESFNTNNQRARIMKEVRELLGCA